jgi:hypothetical protein
MILPFEALPLLAALASAFTRSIFLQSFTSSPAAAQGVPTIKALLLKTSTCRGLPGSDRHRVPSTTNLYW